MRNSFLILLIALIVVGGASYTFVRNKEQRNAELEKLVRKDEAKAKTDEAKKKTAEAEARKAEADAKIASENARKAEAELKTAEAKKAEAALLVQHAEATNAVKQADLQTALAASHLVELDLQRILATSNTLALQKADYATKLVEVEKLQEELRRREEETRPNKTLLQLMEEEEKALQAELAEMAKKDAAFAKEEEIRRRILRDGVPAAPKKPLSAVDQRLLDANASVDNAADEVRSIFEKRMVSRIEALIRQTIKDGRAEDAELYLKSLKSLIPGYEFVP